MSTYTAKLVGERNWTDGANGVRTSVSRKYQIIRTSDPLGTVSDEIVPSEVSGLPQPGEAYSSSVQNLFVSGYSWSDPGANEKRRVFVTVSYALSSTEASESNRAPRGQDIQSIEWRSGTVSRDLVRDAVTGGLIVNTAGQPFDSVPQVEIPSPTWVKIVKTSERKTAWLALHGKVNSAQKTIGGAARAAKTARVVQVDERRLWNDEFGYQYEYTIGIQILNNVVSIEGGAAADIGWNLAFVSAGTMELKDGKLVPITTIDAETHKEVFVESQTLLDEAGAAMLEDAEPYALEVAAYPTATFDDDLVTETPTYRDAQS